MDDDARPMVVAYDDSAAAREASLVTERAQRDHASAIADRGVEIARGEGAVAEAASGLCVSGIAETIAAIALDNNGCASTLPVLVVTER
jgi:hypothetical protein